MDIHMEILLLGEGNVEWDAPCNCCRVQRVSDKNSVHPAVIGYLYQNQENKHQRKEMNGSILCGSLDTGDFWIPIRSHIEATIVHINTRSVKKKSENVELILNCCNSFICEKNFQNYMIHIDVNSLGSSDGTTDREAMS